MITDVCVCGQSVVGSVGIAVSVLVPEERGVDTRYVAAVAPGLEHVQLGLIELALVVRLQLHSVVVVIL